MASRSGKSDGIDGLDLAIVEAMAMNGRMSPADIAATIGNVSERTVRNRLNALIERRLLFFPTIADVSVRRGIYLDVAIDTQAGLMASVADLLVDFPDVEWVAYGGGEHDVYCSLLVFDQASALEVVCARLTGASAAGESPAGRRRLATTSTPSHGPPFVRMEVKR